MSVTIVLMSILLLLQRLHATLAEIGLAAVQAGKHILVEKPAGRRAQRTRTRHQPPQKKPAL